MPQQLLYLSYSYQQNHPQPFSFPPEVLISLPGVGTKVISHSFTTVEMRISTRFILIGTQHGENVGAAARAM